MTLRFVMQIEDPGELRSPDSRGRLSLREHFAPALVGLTAN
jgi:hypothetical protein